MLVGLVAAGSPTGLGALPTLFTARISHWLYDGALGLTVGAMVAVVCREIVPYSHVHGYPGLAPVTFVIGYAVMIFIDTTPTV